MINVSRAICSKTATRVTLRRLLAGTRDEDNFFVAGGYDIGRRILATPVPIGDRDDGVYGEQLKSLNEGERTPKLMQFTLRASKVPVKIKDIIDYKDVAYKIFQVGDYEAGGYYQVQGATAPDVYIGGNT